MKLKGVRTIKFNVKKETLPLENIPCAAIKMSIKNTIDNGLDDKLGSIASDPADPTYSSDDYEVYWGFGGTPAHPIFPTQTTDYIYCENAADISVRTNKKQEAGMELYISIFVEVKEK